MSIMDKVEKEVTRIEVVYREKCPYCKEWIRGRSESQTRYNLRLHEESCKEKAKEKRK